MSRDPAHPNPKNAFVFLFLNFLVFGGIATTVGATLPIVIRHFGWNYLAAGWIFAGSAVGYFVSTFICGQLLPRWGGQKMMLTGLFLQAIGIGLFGMHASWTLNLLLFVILGLGQGGVEVSTNVAVVELESPGKSRMMNFVHAAFTIGAIAAPFLTSALAWADAPWRWVYIMMAIVAGGMFVWTVCSPWLSSIRGVSENHSDPDRRKRKIYREPLLFLLAATIFFYVGAEIGISNWIAEYFVGIHNASVAVGAMMVALFWFGIFLGRVGLGMGYKGNRLASMLFFFSLISLLGLSIALWSQTPWICGLFFFVTGLGYSIIYPCVMSVVGLCFPGDQSSAIGLISTSGGVGVFLFPFLMSALSDRWGLSAGFMFYLGLTVLMCLCAAGSMVLERKRSQRT